MLSVFTNPRGRVVDTLTNRVEEIRYRHKKDGKWYKHKFAPGASLRLLANGEAKLERRDGKPVWGEFAGAFGEGEQKFLTNPGEDRTMATRRARNRFGRFTKGHSRHTTSRKRKSPRRHRVRAHTSRSRTGKVEHVRGYVANAPKRRRRQTRHVVRHHRRSYRRNAPGGIMGQVLTAAKDGVIVTTGQVVTRKLGGLAKQYVPGIGTLTGVASVAPAVLAATAGTYVAHKFAKGSARTLAAGMWSEVFNQVIASQPSLQSMLGAWPSAVALPHPSGGNKRQVQGTRQLAAWPHMAVAAPKMRTV